MNELSLDIQLEVLLSEDRDSVIRRKQTAFELTAPLNKSLVLFGAGRLGKTMLEGLRRAELEPLAFADNNPELWRKSIEGGFDIASP